MTNFDFTKNQKIGIVVGIAVAGVVTGVFIFWGYIVAGEQSHCDNWLANIEERRTTLENDPVASVLDYERFNREIDDYNRECVY